jgi:thiamine-phosphate pyrophosphorylase
MKLPHPPLLLITDRKQAKLPLLAVVEVALAGGCRWISLREKDLSEPEQAALAKELLPVARSAGACMTLHGTPSLARKCAVDGVHLPAGSDPVSARHVLGSSKLVGLSIHSLEEAKAIDTSLVDYAIAGPAFATPSKPDYQPTLGREGFRAIVRACSVPVLAIGGLDPERARETLGWGVFGIAVMGSVIRAANPRAEIAALLAALVPST